MQFSKNPWAFLNSFAFPVKTKIKADEKKYTFDPITNPTTLYTGRTTFANLGKANQSDVFVAIKNQNTFNKNKIMLV